MDEQTGEDVRVTKGDVGGVIPAEAASERDEVGVLIFVTDKRHYFMNKVILILDVAGDAPAG